MKQNNNYLPINWTDGVKLNKNHFLDSYYNVVSNLIDTKKLSLTNYNYGLLTEKTVSKALELDIEVVGNHTVNVKLNYCNAVTENGCRINYSNSLYGKNGLDAELSAETFDKNKSQLFYVLITVNPYNLVPVGEPNPEIVPLHHPSALPNIQVKIVSSNNLNRDFLTNYFLIVGKINWHNNAFVVEDYIPPSANFNANKKLMEFYNSVCVVVDRLRNNSLTIITKNEKINDKRASNTIALCRSVIDFATANHFQLANTGAMSAPIFLFEKTAQLANKLVNNLRLINSVEKEELLSYYYEWIDVKPSDFESALASLAGLKYNHNEIYESLKKADYFYAILSKLWAKLSELEYIGQRKDSIIIREINDSLQSNSNKGHTIIDQ